MSRSSTSGNFGGRKHVLWLNSVYLKLVVNSELTLLSRERGKKKADHSAQYFSHSNAEASALREQLAVESLESLISWLKNSGGNVGIMGESYKEGLLPELICFIDATNSTFSRRFVVSLHDWPAVLIQQ